MDEKLLQANLFGGGFLLLNTPQLVGRYNATLERLGLQPTRLDTFQIDGLGWSPEIAVEREDPAYLSAGVANPLAILVSPDQWNKPIYCPFNSYDRLLMRSYFLSHREAIATITATGCLGLDIDLELTKYTSPRDLLLVDYIVVRSYAGDIGGAARSQRELVETFEQDDLSWFDTGLRTKIIESAKLFGDLRFRQVEVPVMKFNLDFSYHTRAMGGVFLLRSRKHARTLLIVEEDRHLKESLREMPDVFHLGSPALIHKLYAENLVDIDMEWYRKNLEFLRTKRECLIVDTLCAAFPNLEYGDLDEMQRKRKLKEIEGQLPEVFHELERTIKMLGKSIIPDVQFISEELRLLLVHPQRKLPSEDQDVIWHLLSRLHPVDIVQLYTADKNAFYRLYREWPEAKKQWAIKFIGERAMLPVYH